MAELQILYEDNHLIAVYKPVGILVQADKSGQKTLMDEVKEYLKKKYNKPGNVFLGLIHRLDRPVSGIILFAKTSKGASRLSEQFRDHTIQKTYQAVVEGVIEKQTGVLINFLEKDEDKNRVKIFDKEVSGSQRAELHYKVLKSSAKHSLVEVNLKTGRSHQIRAQFAYIGHPIVGDVKYGAQKALPDQSIALCAIGLQFKLPTQDEYESIVVATPVEWNVFWK
jgi:23S rRNA pseudouridine1911/1915/1917 synthase